MVFESVFALIGWLSMTEYTRNHYVPEWYQKRFIPTDRSKHFYLDLSPEQKKQNGHSYTRKELKYWGPKRCFAKDDLYTLNWGGLENRDIEKFFFGKVDRQSRSALDYFDDFSLHGDLDKNFRNLLTYMSLQKLRTPKGLQWLRHLIGNRSKNQTLLKMQELQNIFCAIWSESVWQIADASKSPTKFIISDHPVVAYNRECFPASRHCTGWNDPDIRHVATHTYFPLSPEKVLILTNLSWVRNPYQNPLRLRPNPNFFRDSIFNATKIQLERYLMEEEVLEINFITKQRAYRYIAAPQKEWLYPERRLASTHWRRLGDGYLLMPDPRHIRGGGEVVIGFEGGGSDAFGAYGHKPWQAGYKDEQREERERKSLDRFQAEWAAFYGPDYRAVEIGIGQGEPMRTMRQEWFENMCERDAENLKRSGEKARRRKLRKRS